MNKPDWSKAPSGATHYHPVNNIWLRNIKPDSYEWTGNGVWKYSEEPVYSFMISQLVAIPRRCDLEPWRPHANTLGVAVATGAAIRANMAILRMMRASK